MFLWFLLLRAQLEIVGRSDTLAQKFKNLHHKMTLTDLGYLRNRSYQPFIFIISLKLFLLNLLLSTEMHPNRSTKVIKPNSSPDN